MLRNLASSLFLTERDDEDDNRKPRVAGRVVTTLPKAKEVRPLVERCISIARRSLPHAERAEQYATTAKRESEEWRAWRSSETWQQWCEARAPVVAARRQVLRLLGDKEAVEILFEIVAPRFADRDGGYTRLLKLAQPRLGDAGERAILEFVGVHDRVSVASERPAFADDEEPETDDNTLDEEDREVTAEAESKTQAADDTVGESDAGEEASEEDKKESSD
jgi:large subunit ribosomal protein L17